VAATSSQMAYCDSAGGHIGGDEVCYTPLWFLLVIVLIDPQMTYYCKLAGAGGALTS
jgi:hypothetical protein